MHKKTLPARMAGQSLLLSLAAIVLLVAFDQWTKSLAVGALAGNGAIPLLPGILELTYVENRGAAFGILQNARAFFFLVTLFALAVIVCLLVKIPPGRRHAPMRACLLLIAAGAAGNFLDRALLSYVRDFIYFSLIDFPVFNLADIYITCATFALVLLAIFYYKEDEDFAFLNGRAKREEP